MNRLQAVIDESWYRRIPHARERISAGGVVLRWENQQVYVALALEEGFPFPAQGRG